MHSLLMVIATIWKKCHFVSAKVDAPRRTPKREETVWRRTTSRGPRAPPPPPPRATRRRGVEDTPPPFAVLLPRVVGRIEVLLRPPSSVILTRFEVELRVRRRAPPDHADGPPAPVAPLFAPLNLERADPPLGCSYS